MITSLRLEVSAILQVRTSPEVALHQQLLLYIILAVTALLFMAAPGWAAKKIVIEHDGRQTVVRTSARTVRQILNQASVVKINQQEIALPVSSVTSLLARQGIELEADDRVEGNLVSGSAGLHIRVVRVRKVLVQEVASVPYGTIDRPDDRLYQGVKKMLVAGSSGLVRRVDQVTYEDNKPVERVMLSDVEIKAPRVKVVTYGTRQRPQATARTGASSRSAKVIQVIATAYTHTGSHTATGAYPKPGTVAVDPAVIPLGTKMFIEGYGAGTAQDTGGNIKGNRIDVFFETYDEAIRWGKRAVNLYIYE
ncbi:MAG: G5 and 3D domain-containing protein [Bacillota bacterium]